MIKSSLNIFFAPASRTPVSKTRLCVTSIGSCKNADSGAWGQLVPKAFVWDQAEQANGK